MGTGLLLASEDGLSNLLAARSQMAMTLGVHIILACFGVGMPVLLLFAEWRHLRTGDEGWRTLPRRWSKAFAVLFAVGAVSGTVLSFELGLLWPAFMGTFGSVIGLPFTLEGFAFFLEAIFAGIYLYGWDRLSPRVHWLTGFPIAVSGAASAWFVVTANSWMNCPQGFTLRDGVVVDAAPFTAMLNPATGAQTAHRCVIGSQAYGLADAESDVDRRGIYLPSADLHWSLYGVPEQLENDATQEAYWELQKFLVLALKANPNILECLYTPMVEKATPLAEELLAMKSMFLSRVVYQTFNGYVLSQFKKMQADIRNQGTVKWKHVMHLIRLLISGISVLKHGFVPVRVEGHRDQLLAIKRGEM